MLLEILLIFIVHLHTDPRVLTFCHIYSARRAQTSRSCNSGTYQVIVLYAGFKQHIYTLDLSTSTMSNPTHAPTPIPHQATCHDATSIPHAKPHATSSHTHAASSVHR
ncbi:hypothetical protein DFH29DRAFT_891625 [Suillus ampliporus]|nr:hypothetical protein DFH29DRAFT_891625 [Suillus ampliporus]